MTPYDPKKDTVVIEDSHGNTITLSNGKITIKSVGLLELKAASITLNGRIVTPSSDPI
jgi:hypothetical protein